MQQHRVSLRRHESPIQLACFMHHLARNSFVAALQITIKAAAPIADCRTYRGCFVICQLPNHFHEDLCCLFILALLNQIDEVLARFESFEQNGAGL